MSFTFPRPTNKLMDNACTEHLVQVIKVTERLLMEPQSCGGMCLSAPEGQDCLPESRSVEKALLNRGHLRHNSNRAIPHMANIRLYKALSILKQ